MARDIGQMGEAFVDIVLNRKDFRKDLKKAEKDTRKSANRMQNSFKKVSNRLGTIGDQLTQIGKQMTMKGGLGLAAAAAGMYGLLKPAGQLQSELAEVNTLFSQTTFQAEEYRQAIIELSKSVPKSTSTLTQGLYQIKSAGVEAGETMDFLKTAAVASTAGLTDVETTVTALTKTLNGFGMESSEVTTVADKMFKTIEEGQIKFGQIAQVLPRVTAVASNAGMSLDEMFGTIAAGTKVLSPEQTTVGLARMITSLQKASDEQKELAKQAGFTFDIEAFREKGIIEFLEDMREGLDESGLSIREFFRREQGARLATNLLGDSFEALKEDIDEVSDSENAIARAFQKQMKTFNKQARLAWNNITALVKSIGSELLPEYTKLTKQIRAVAGVLTNRFNNASDETRNRIADLISTVIKLTAGLSSFVVVAGLVSLALGTVLKSIQLVGIALTVLSSPIFLLIGVLGLLYTAWKNDWGGMQEKLTNVWEKMSNTFDKIYNWLEDLWSKMKEGDWSGVWNQITTTLQNAWNKLSSWEGWGKLYGYIKEAWNASWQFLKDSWKDLKGWKGWGDIADWIKDNTPASIAKMFGFAKEGAGIVINATIEFAGKTYKAIKKGFQTGDWSDAIGIGADVWKKGANILIGFKVSQVATAALMKKISSALPGKGMAMLGVVGMISIGVQLFEAKSGGKTWEEVGQNLVAALAAGIGIGAFTGHPQAGVLTFTIVMNLEWGEKLDLNLKPKDALEDILGFNYNLEKRVNQLIEGNIPNSNGGGGAYKSGGYTGNVGRSQPAGIVHGGEFVMPAWMVDKYPQLAAMLENMRQGKGYKDGGYVDRAKAALKTATQSVTENAPDVLNTMLNVMESLFGVIIDKLKKRFPKFAEEVETIINTVNSVIEDMKSTLSGTSTGGGNRQRYGRPKGKGSQSPIPAWSKMMLNLQMGFDKMKYSIVSKWNAAVDTWNNAKDWIQKPWSEKVDDMKNLFAEGVMSLPKTFSGMGKTVKKGGKALLGQSQAGQGLMEIFSGNFISGILSLFQQSKAFSKLLKSINPILQSLADIVGAVLYPVFQILAPVLKIIAEAFRTVADVLIGFWNGLMDLLSEIPFVDMEEYKVSLEDMTDETNETTEALRNFPQAFKIASARFASAQGYAGDIPSAAVGGTVQSSGIAEVHKGEIIANREQQNSMKNSPIIIKGDIFGWNDFKDKVNRARDLEIKRRKNSSTGLSRT